MSTADSPQHGNGDGLTLQEYAFGQRMDQACNSQGIVDRGTYHP